MFQIVKEFVVDTVLGTVLEWAKKQSWWIALMAALIECFNYLGEIPNAYMAPIFLSVFCLTAWLIIGVHEIRERYWPMAIPIMRAAQIAREDTYGTPYEKFAEESAQGADLILCFYARQLLEKAPIEAKKVGSRRSLPIPRNQQSRLHFNSNDCNSLMELHDSSPRYIDPSIRLHHLREAIRWMRGVRV